MYDLAEKESSNSILLRPEDKHGNVPAIMVRALPRGDINDYIQAE